MRNRRIGLKALVVVQASRRPKREAVRLWEGLMTTSLDRRKVHTAATTRAEELPRTMRQRRCDGKPAAKHAARVGKEPVSRASSGLGQGRTAGERTRAPDAPTQPPGIRS